jgi:hypothetical protein
MYAVVVPNQNHEVIRIGMTYTMLADALHDATV